MDALTQYLNHIDGMIRRLDIPARRQLSARIGRILRQRRKASIKANTTPEGTAHPGRRTPDGTPMTGLRQGQQFLYHGKIRRFKTMRDIGLSYIGWEYTTRKPFTAHKKRIKKPARNQLMFRKLNQFRFLKSRTDANEAAIGFFGGLTGYIAAAHQDGFSGRTERRLLGLSDEDMRLIEAMIASHLEQQS